MNATYKKHIVVTVCLLLVSSGACIALVRFGLTMKVKQVRVAEVKERLVSYEQNKKIFADEALALKAIGERTTALEQHLVAINDVPELLSSFEAMAKAGHVAFAITAVSTPSDKTARTLLIDFSAQGTYEDITAFTERLLSQPYEIQFTKFSLFVDTGIDEPSVAVATVIPEAPKTASAIPKPAKKAPMWELLASIKVLSF